MGETVGAGSLPRQLGRYELITRIGNGGMADVYLARQRGPMGFEKLVVLKLAHPNLAAQKSFVDMLLREARVAALLKHANVVDVYELGEVDGTYFIAMEYLEGEPMLALLRAGRDQDPLDPLSIARIIADAAEGLHAAHELRSLSGERVGLVHHDVSPGNIMVLYSGHVKLVDFGVANALNEALLDADGRKMVAGKLGYLAPEKLRGEAFDHRSDLFSLGVVMWESLTNKRLYKGEPDALVRQQVLTVPPVAPSSVNSGVPAALDSICLKALEKDPVKRYATAAEMAAALETVLRGARYNNKNALIAKYMRDTFASRLAVREQLIREASSVAGPTASTVAAALDLNRQAPLTETPATGVPVVRPSSANLLATSIPTVAATAVPSVIPSIRKGFAAVEMPELAGVLAKVPAPNLPVPSPALASVADVEPPQVDSMEAVANMAPRAPLAPLPPIVATPPRAALPGPTRQPNGSTPVPLSNGALAVTPSATALSGPAASDVVPATAALSPALPPALPLAALPRLATEDAEFLDSPSMLVAADSEELAEPWQAAPRSRTPWIIGAVAVAVAAVMMIVALGGNNGNKKVIDAAPMVAMTPPDAAVVESVDAGPVVPTVDAARNIALDANKIDAVAGGDARIAVVKDPVVKDPVVKDPVVKDPVKPPSSTRAQLDGKYKVALQQFLKGDSHAIAGFRSIVRADASYAAAWRGLGLALAKSGDKAEAAKALKKYLALAPKAADAAQIRARVEQLK